MRKLWLGLAVAGAVLPTTACKAITGLDRNYEEIDCYPTGVCPDGAVDASMDAFEDDTSDGGPMSKGSFDQSSESMTGVDGATESGSDQIATTTGMTDSSDQDGSADSGADATTCTDACTGSQTICAAGGVQTCRREANGCTQWITTAACGAHQACQSVEAGTSCTCRSTACTQLGSACQDMQTLATCATDADGCYYVASTSPCATPKSCSGMAPGAACSLTCTDSCTQGQTTCVAGDLATCTLGSNGCWAYGAAVACGTHQSCTGAVGASACTCNADPACSTTGNTCANSTTFAVCSKDSQGCVYQSASSLCRFACSGGSCTGVCTPNATQCSGNGIQTCGSNGQWGGTIECNERVPFCANGACTAPPSCQTSGPGLTDCGPYRESCCMSLQVPGGTYNRTYTNSGGGPTGQADPASVSGFRLDRYDVTVGRFRQFVKAWNGGAGWMPSTGSGKHAHLNNGDGLRATSGGYETGWVASDNSNLAPTNDNLACGPNYPTWTNAIGSNENLPINCVNWWEAYAFCIWDGGLLPSLAEYEYAAAGGSEQREYPWGTLPPGTDSQHAIYGCYYPNGSGTCTGAANIAPVGTAAWGTGLWGQRDLVGNVSQWTLDWYAGYATPCTDCAQLTGGSLRVFRGGDFMIPAQYLISSGQTYPSRTDPSGRGAALGFRCARSP